MEKALTSKIKSTILTTTSATGGTIGTDYIKVLGIDENDKEFTEFAKKHKIEVVDYETDRETENALILKAQNGNEKAFEEIVNRYAPLCNAYARRYSNNISFEDHLGIAYLSLVKAVKKYNPDHGMQRFGGYAKMIIRNDLIEAIKDDRHIHVSYRTEDAVNKVRRWAKENYISDRWTEAEYAQCSEDLGISIRRVKEYANIIFKTNISYYDSFTNNNMNSDDCEADGWVLNSCNAKQIKSEEETEKSAEDMAISNIQNEELSKLIDMLPDTDKVIVMLLYGFNNNGETSKMKDIMKATGLSDFLLNKRINEILNFFRHEMGVYETK